jgi:hypothetical protein
MKNDTTTTTTTLLELGSSVLYTSILFIPYSIHSIHSIFHSFHSSPCSLVKIRSNTPPENRCRYCVVDDFNGLSVDDIITVSSDGWVVCVPSFEIDVDIVVAHCLRCVGGVSCSSSSARHRSLPHWKNEFFWLDNDFRNFAQSGFLDDFCQLFVRDST